MSRWVLYVRDSSLRRVAQIDDYQELNVALKFNAVSTWDIRMAMDSDAAMELVNGSGLVVTVDGEVLLSGPLTKKEMSHGTENTLRASGADDTVWLERTLVLPVPQGPPYSAAAYDVRTGVAEAVMHAYVNDHAGPGAKAERRVTGLTLGAMGGGGGQVTGRGRFQPLIELLAELAFAGGDLGFRVIQVGTGLEFQVYVPRDQTAVAKFSEELGNIAAYSFMEEAPTVNYGYVGGSGEDEFRTFYEAPNTQGVADWGRIEGFADRRDAEDVSELSQTLNETLAEGAGRVTAAVTPTDTEAVRFMREYRLGDMVTAVLHEGEVTDVIRALNVRLVPEQGQVITPAMNPASAVAMTIGQPTVSGPPPPPVAVGGTSPTVFIAQTPQVVDRARLRWDSEYRRALRG